MTQSTSMMGAPVREVVDTQLRFGTQMSFPVGASIPLPWGLSPELQVGLTDCSEMVVWPKLSTPLRSLTWRGRQGHPSVFVGLRCDGRGVLRGAGVQLGMTGIGYNTNLFKEKGWAPPTSWLDFADPKYKGKVVFQSASSSTFGLHGFLALNRLWGGSEKNVEPSFSKWATTVGPNVVEYIPNSAKLSEMITTGEAGLFPLTPTAIGDLKDKGLPVAYVAPREGAVLLLVDVCVVKNNSDPALAQKLAQYLLSAPAQTKAAQAGKQIPTNTQAKMTPDMEKNLGDLNALVKKVTVVDWDSINANRAQWDQRWNQQIEK